MTYVIYVLTFVVFIVPASLFLHELGHALTGKRFRADKLYISLGSGKKLLEKRFRTLHVTVRIVFFFNSFSVVERSMPLEKFEKNNDHIDGPVGKRIYQCYSFFFLFNHLRTSIDIFNNTI